MFAKLIHALKLEQIEHAKEALSKTPSNPDLFNYGRSVGYYQGLERALQLIDEITKDADERERSEPVFDP